MGTAVLYALDYFIGFPVLGIVFYVLNGILVEFLDLAPNNIVLTYANLLWGGVLVFWLVVGLFWLPRKLKEWGGLK